MATYTCTGCKPIDASIIDAYVALVGLNQSTAAAESSRVTAEGERVSAENERTRVFNADHGRAEQDHTDSANATLAANNAAAAANAAGITSAEASVDANVGTPSVDVSLSNKRLSLSFHNIKGEKGDKGDRGDGAVPVVNDLTTGGTTSALSAEMGKTLNNTKQATLVSGANIKTVNGESLLGEGNIVAGDPNAVKYTEQTLTDAQKTQARTNIGAGVGSYSKPGTGIPKTDLDSGVQASLDLADTAIQARPSGEVDPTITPAEYATQEELSQLDQEIGDMSSHKEEGWDTVALTATTGYYFKFDTLATYEQSLAEYVALSVQPGEKYLIDGWNWSSNAPLAFVRKAGTTTKARAIYQSSAGHMSGEYTIPDGYDTLYVNGRTANYPIVVKKWVLKQTTIVDILDTKADAEDAVSAPLHVSVRQNANYVAGSSTVYGWNIAVGRRFNNSHDVVWFVGNKNSSINNFFDFQSIYLATRGEKKVSPVSSTSAMTYILGHVTDYILPIVVAAVSNKDGDFPDNTSYYTGGYHGYGNATSGEVSQTMRQVSRSVRLDGKELAAGDDLYGSVLEIDVVNNVQGCNTEKENGSGREIIQQHIHITMDSEKFDVTVEWTALEAVNVHTLHCFGQYFDFDTVRFVGSTSKPGAYAKGAYHVATDKKTSIVRNVGSSYTFDVEMDRNFGVADSFLGGSGNALATTSNKGYFNAVGDTPISMNSGDMVAYRGCYRFYPTPATT